ncbi:hypothetical protein H6F61_20255 [Cyanobacteria bacterium FACHB-472]|nr:hypothetical protein [Cyanobacteria bacterium FACHB-472]
MKNVLEVKNFLKELIKGTFLDDFARSILNIAKLPDRWEVINRQDTAFTTQFMSRVLTNYSNSIDVGCNTGDFLIKILQLSPLGYHYAFEPIPRLANRL